MGVALIDTIILDLFTISIPQYNKMLVLYCKLILGPEEPALRMMTAFLKAQ